ncbi:MAG TPA: hypothetical protein VLE91_05160 [Candidatus Saccharimonadales bacterium]|nr:hypothetical protein [Candidatus Saccharimonadales bacterium]
MLAKLRPKSGKEIPFIIFSSFLATYIVIRIFIYFFPFLFLNMRGVHVHHFAYGFLILTAAGLYDLIMRPTGKFLDRTAIVFGIGMAFSYDEFGMWLRLRDYDVARFGYDAVIIISLLLLSIIYFEDFWKRTGKTFVFTLKNQLSRLIS